MAEQVIGGKSQEENSSHQSQPQQECSNQEHPDETDHLTQQQYARAASSSSSDPEIRKLFKAREKAKNRVEQAAIDREIQKRLNDKGKSYRENNRVVHQAHQYINQPAKPGPGGPRH